MTTTTQYGGYYGSRGIAQPERRQDRHETDEEKRRRLHREAAEAVKRHAAALREAKALYQEYDRAMSEASQDAHEPPQIPEAPKATET